MTDTLYTLLLVAEFAAALIVLPTLFFVSAPYGRHYRGNWGPVLQSRIGWLVMEFPALAVMPILYVANRASLAGSVSWFFLVVWEIHYVYRDLIYPWLLRGSRRSFPIVVVLLAMGFNLTNGYVNGHALFAGQTPATAADLLNVHVIAGLAIFLGGLALNIWSDAIIRDLRRDLRENHSGARYGIPRRGLFRFVSSPNYLGEIVEWIGWAILTGTVAGWAFALFTFANLMPRAVANHRWYHVTFPDYPPERKILIPWVF